MRRLLIAVTLAVAPLGLQLHAQGRGTGPAGAAAGRARAAAPFDITGYWVSLVTDDWRYRMLTPPKGNVDYLPVTAEARRVADTWDPAKDVAAGEQCKAYGAGGIMRLPARLHVTWDDDNTLKMDIDAGTQTRRFFFESTPQLATAASAGRRADVAGLFARALGVSQAPGEARPAPAAAAPARRPAEGRDQRTCVPDTFAGTACRTAPNTTLTEYFVRLVDSGGQEYLVVTTMVDDPTYFQPAYIKTYEFKKQRDATGWNPQPCGATSDRRG